MGWRVAIRRPATVLAAAALGGATYAAGHVDGSYEKTQWPLLGLGLLALLWLLLCAGRRPPRLVVAAAAALVALGCWTAASSFWGGLPDVGWSGLDASLIGAAALLVGTLAGPRHEGLVSAGVLAGITAQAVDVVAETAASGLGTTWFNNRTLDGPVGYHNAQGAVFAVALPLAARYLADDRRLRRLGGAAAAAVLLAALLLTQSRGALIAAGLALVLQVLLSRRLRLAVSVCALAVVGAGLMIPLRRVDAPLVDGSSAELLTALRWYALATAGAVCVLAVLALPQARRLPVRRQRPLALAAVLAALVVAAAVVVAQSSLPARASAAVAQLRSDAPPTPPAGDTRFASLTLNGRLEVWRYALQAFRSEPVVGLGSGRFTQYWIEKRPSYLYVLQPHSIELELASETGAVGLGLFLAFVGLCLAALARAGRRAAPIAAAGAFVVLLLQASADWTWSFPGLVAPVLLAVGAAAGRGAPPRTHPLRVFVPASLVVLVAGALFLAPYLSAAERKTALSLASSNPASAADHARLAHRLDPFAADVVELQARLAGSRGEYALAAARYRRAASLSRDAWYDEFLAANMLDRAGRAAARDRSCALAAAANPLEQRIRQQACSRPTS